MTKEELLTKLEPIIDKSLKLSNLTEDSLVGRIVLLSNKASKGDADAILEMAILGTLLANK